MGSGGCCTAALCIILTLTGSPLVLGAIAIFVYVGAEVTIGSFLVNFLSQPDIGGLSAAQAGRYVSLYAVLAVGLFNSIMFPTHLN